MLTTQKSPHLKSNLSMSGVSPGLRTLSVVDSHTGGEPTRVVLDVLPGLERGTIVEKAARFANDYNDLRRGIICEPRGCDWLVGALLLPPESSETTAGVIFFNNVGTIGMCGHGMIGVVETLIHLGRIAPGGHRFDTPVGQVTAVLRDDGRVSIENVASYRSHKQTVVDVPGYGPVVGDIAYSGNWFFLTKVDAVEPSAIAELDAKAKAIRKAIDDQGITGAAGGRIDHIELFGSPTDPDVADSRSYVLCPGGEYDRSPCGTGTCAKVACLAADGLLAPGEVWKQQSITGSVFEASYRLGKVDRIIPTVTGRAFVTGESTLRFHPDDVWRGL